MVPDDFIVTPRNLGIKDASFIAFKDQKPSKSALARVSSSFIIYNLLSNTSLLLRESNPQHKN